MLRSHFESHAKLPSCDRWHRRPWDPKAARSWVGAITMKIYVDMENVLKDSKV